MVFMVKFLTKAFNLRYTYFQQSNHNILFLFYIFKKNHSHQNAYLQSDRNDLYFYEFKYYNKYRTRKAGGFKNFKNS